jgi:prepilin-type N-terminal cleavage/methylation domain-containing protein/prepilin-type processing-associated H-X9-DG protein
MEERRGLTLAELIVTLFVVAVVVAILLPATGKDPVIAKRVVCGHHLKELGQAMTVYADDYDGLYPQLPGSGPWSKTLGFNYDLEEPDFRGAQSASGRTVTASWYLLVRQADVPLKTFTCPASKTKEFELAKGSCDYTKLWDFGPDPYKHVDYSMHLPYGRFPAKANLSAAFALGSDMNPWFQNGEIVPAGENGKSPQLLSFDNWDSVERDAFGAGNYQLHIRKFQKFGEGQNVLFADGHASYETRPNVGVDRDNIFTYWSVEENPTEQERQGGKAPTGRGPENDAKSREDSFLAI